MWIIDKDHTADDDIELGTNGNAAGMIGPANSGSNTEKCVHKFRMYDDDGELYYEGRCSGISFAPLDDFGAPNAGCTRIDYYFEDIKTWSVL